MTISLFSRCLGCSSTFAAMTQFPEAFDGVPLPGRAPAGHHENHRPSGGWPCWECRVIRIDDLEQRVILQTSIGFARRAPQEWARNVRVPTFLYQVHDDVLTEPSDVQTSPPISPSPSRGSSGSTAPRAAGTDTWSSSASPSRCSNGSPST